MTNGLWIAALVVEHDLALRSWDVHLDHLPHLRQVAGGRSLEQQHPLYSTELAGL